ncbi:hypothetical protein [Metabacillus malikii]|uniref:Uncharacterized protein n=1 Tax=Metabacillus malikii TaxID=1504265 RepID=A0ABT9ZCH1_9BACI|nr:hypothetical protein [Metabacillus malikii]MDQ0229506.1 hypothetical protein [Metabacillus malikii]
MIGFLPATALLGRHIDGLLCAKKIVFIRSEIPNYWHDVHGIKIVKQLTPYETELELDTDKLSLKDFIRIVNDRFTMVDMTIDSLPIENIINVLYLQDKQVV